jgi:hypothetical protein
MKQYMMELGHQPGHTCLRAVGAAIICNSNQRVLWPEKNDYFVLYENSLWNFCLSLPRKLFRMCTAPVSLFIHDLAGPYARGL